MNFIKEIKRLFIKNSFHNVTPKNIVFITGCDSGLGFNLSLLCHSLNMTVISGCLDLNSEGANILKKISSSSQNKEHLISPKIIPIELNLLQLNSIAQAYDLITNLIEENAYNLTALVNNAGIMCFGEFEWQTNDIFESQIQVNLLGTMKITSKFLPLIRLQKSRIINITSHCGLSSLPGLSPYAASKAGIRFWNDSLRMEVKKYGVNVVNFIPGSFVTLSNIAARQQIYAKEMLDEFNEEQKQFYGDYFENYNGYLKFISEYKTPIVMNDKLLMEKFKCALLHRSPAAIYKHEPWRYTIYFWMFKILPVYLTDWLTSKFVAMPAYKCRKIK